MKYHVDVQGDVTTLYLKGNIDDGIESILEEIDHAVKTTGLIIDLEYLAFLNSIGLSQWMRFLARVTSRCNIVYRRCPLNYLDFLDMTAHVINNSKFESALYPAECPACETETVVQVLAKNRFEVPPTETCKKCTAVLPKGSLLKDYTQLLSGSVPRG